MLKQLLISVVVIVVAAAGYVFFVPGATETLARYGINLPVPASNEGEAATSAPNSGQGGRGQGGGNQQQANAGPGNQPAGGTTGAPAAGNRGQGGGGGFGRGGRGGNRSLVVVTAAVTESTINDKLTAIGEGAAARSVTVVSPSSGTLVELAVSPGDIVEPGDVIGRLDAEAEQIAADRARLTLEDAETTLERTQNLANANSATTVQLNTAQLAASNARLELQNAELALSRRTITTPIGGTVGLFQASAGNIVGANTVITTIEDTTHITVAFWVPERYASVLTPGLALSAQAVALPGENISGEISAVDNRIDPASRTLKVEARIPNQNRRLRPGMSFSVSMSFAGETFPSVDPLAIQWSSDGAYLWKYVDGKVERQLVEIVQRNSDGILIKGPLTVGEQVVVQGVQQLTAGASVRLLDEAPADGQGGSNRTAEGGAPAEGTAQTGGGGQGGGQQAATRP